MKDYIVRGVAGNASVRAFAAVTTHTVEEAKRLHGLSPIACAALGRTLTAAAMMSGTLKGDKDTLTIQIKGKGPLGGIVVVADSRARVRGYVHNPNVYLPLNEEGKLNVAAAIGKDGYLNIIKDLGLKEPYIGFVNLVSGEIAEDITYYFAHSEQTPSVVGLGVLIDKDGSVINAGGFIIQLMPGVEENIIDYIEKKIKEIPSVTGMLSEVGTPEGILEKLLGEIGLEIYEKMHCKFECNCSKERMERNLISLGKKEIMGMIDEQKGAEVQCHFCNRKYNFDVTELSKLVELLSR